MLFSFLWGRKEIIFINQGKLKPQLRGTWVAQSVKRLILDLGSGHDLTVCEFEPHVRLCADGMEPVWDSVSPSLCLSPTCACVLFLSLSK